MDDASLCEMLLDGSDVILNSGYTKPLASSKLYDRAEIVRTVSLHYALLQSLAEMDQLKMGLQSLGFLQIYNAEQSKCFRAIFYLCRKEKFDSW